MISGDDLVDERPDVPGANTPSAIVFRAHGTVAELVALVAPDDETLPLGTSQGGALVHVVEVLFQHLGQLELTRDVLLRS